MASAARIAKPDPVSPPLSGAAVKEELAARVGQLDRDFRLLSIGELCRRADLIRQIARANGYEPVSRLAGGLANSLARGGRGAPVRPWLDALGEALVSDAQDEATARAFLASVSVRLVG
jgi:hypothetical protein